jgi:hypothetical protein
VKRIFLFFILVIGYTNSQAQFGFENMVELTGVVMSSDSLRYLPFVSVSIPSKQRGTVSTDRGVFSLIAEKGDTLEFSYVGYRKKTYIIPKELSSSRYSIIQLMTQDTLFLDPSIIRVRLSPEEFDLAFRTWDIPDDQFEVARKNTENQRMTVLLATLPRDGRESQSVVLSSIAQRNYWAGQQPPMTIFSPLAWAEFLKAWKRGDFKKKFK